MGGSLGGGASNSNSSSAPVGPRFRTKMFEAGLENLSQVMPGFFNADGTFKAPDYVAPTPTADFKGLSGGDYEKLQRDVLAGNTAGLDYAKERDLKSFNDTAAKRGVWSSGLAVQGENDVNHGYVPAYAKAGGDATAMRYALESGDLNNLNQFNTSRDNFNMNNANMKYTSGWAPAQYLADLWKSTNGQNSASKSDSWNASASAGQQK